MEQRRYMRIMGNTDIYISDQAGFCTGTLKDFSRFGICISDLPRKIHSDSGLFKASFVCNNLNFKLQLDRKWIQKEGLTNVVGAIIEGVPWDWTEMVMRHESTDEDVWQSQPPLRV